MKWIYGAYACFEPFRRQIIGKRIYSHSKKAFPESSERFSSAIKSKQIESDMKSVFSHTLSCSHGQAIKFASIHAIEFQCNSCHVKYAISTARNQKIRQFDQLPDFANV
jgi:hypothetical protein